MTLDEAYWFWQLVGNKPGYAVEVGAADGEFTSLTLPLEAEDWHVLCVEPNPLYAAKARFTRRNVVEVAAADFDDPKHVFTLCNVDHNCKLHEMQGGSSLAVQHEHLNRLGWTPKGTREIWVKVQRLDTILEEAAFPRLDFLSVDTEGTEDAVLRGLNFEKYKPRVIVAENWPGINKTDHILLPLGYKHVPRVTGNFTDWYVLEDK